MDRLRRATSLTQNSSSSSKDSKKNKISNKIEKSLHDWKLPLSSASDVFSQFLCMSFSPDCTSKTVEKEIPLSEGYATFPLFTENLQRVHQKNDHYLHVGMIQVGLKPTKLGSNTSAIICLRDKRLRNFHESILGMVESSLRDGPIYFSYIPTHRVSLADRYLSSAFTIDVKTQLEASTDENIILAYRFHYKLLHSFDPDPKISVRDRDVNGETTLFIQNLARRNCVVSKKVYWDQVSVPEGWMVRANPSASFTGETNARVDWEETAEAHVLRVDVPGFKSEEIKIEVEDGGILQFSGERSNEHEDKGHVHKWHCQERSSGGKLLRRFTLPENADLEKMKVAMKNGVLTVTVPKEESQVQNSLALVEL